jgi:DNA-binding LacI/PurR family transcriptional regulator
MVRPKHIAACAGVSIMTVSKALRDPRDIPPALGRRVDGLFVTPVYRFEPRAAAYEALQRSGVPTVLLGHAAPFCSQFASVETDD